MTCRTEILLARGCDLMKLYRGDEVVTASGRVALVVTPGTEETLVMFTPTEWVRLRTATLRLLALGLALMLGLGR